MRRGEATHLGPNRRIYYCPGDQSEHCHRLRTICPSQRRVVDMLVTTPLSMEEAMHQGPRKYYTYKNHISKMSMALGVHDRTAVVLAFWRCLGLGPGLEPCEHWEPSCKKEATDACQV